MKNTLRDKKIAILVTDGFEEVELTEPLKAFEAAGATVEIVSPNEREIRSFSKRNWGGIYSVDVSLSDAISDEYDALVLPGGVMNPDKLRQDKNAVAFVREFFTQEKVVASICHGPWTLIEADVIKGRTLTSYPSLATDIENAGGIWIDKEVVVNGNLITSRKPDDIPAFIEKTIDVIRGRHAFQFV